MDQISFLFDGPSFPLSYDDFQSLYEKYIFEGEKDADAFTWSEIKDGRSYFMYGKKVLEFLPGDEKKARIRLFSPDSPSKPRSISSDASAAVLLDALEALKSLKKRIFRNTITEVFGCCHDFTNCSEKKQCLHPEDRFYNGCEYRKNLESGRIFYGSNRNI